jgi:hypothetical protein
MNEGVGDAMRDSVINEPKIYTDSIYGPALTQIQLSNGDKLHDAGFRGQGMTIAVIDAGFHNLDKITAMRNSRVFDHVQGKCILGFKLLVCAFFDGKSTIPIDMSLHCEKGKKKDFGLTAKQRKNRFSKKRKKEDPNFMRFKESTDSKLQVAVEMLKRAWAHKSFYANFFKRIGVTPRQYRANHFKGLE